MSSSSFHAEGDRALREAAELIARERGLRLVVLFGSTARGGKKRPQDLDVAILGRTSVDVCSKRPLCARRSSSVTGAPLRVDL